MNKQTSWVITDLRPANILKMINPFRRLMTWYYNRIMSSYLLPIINGSISELSSPSKNKPKTINLLALQGYLSETGAHPTDIHTLDKAFTDSVIAQMKIFMLAGHDTTASTVAFIFQELERHPACLAALRAEHNAVFGPDPSTASSQLTTSPQLLNSLPYTLSIIKETLRLYPPSPPPAKANPLTSSSPQPPAPATQPKASSSAGATSGNIGMNPSGRGRMNFCRKDGWRRKGRGYTWGRVSGDRLSMGRGIV